MHNKRGRAGHYGKKKASSSAFSSFPSINDNTKVEAPILVQNASPLWLSSVPPASPKSSTPPQQQQNTYTIKTIEGYQEISFVDFDTAISQHVEYIQLPKQVINLVDSRVVELSDARSQRVFNNPNEYNEYCSSKIIQERIEKRKREKELEEEKKKVEEKKRIEQEKQSTENKLNELRELIMKNYSYFMKCKKYLNINDIEYTYHDDSEIFDFQEDSITEPDSRDGPRSGPAAFADGLVTPNQLTHLLYSSNEETEKQEDLQVRKITSSTVSAIDNLNRLQGIYGFMKGAIILAHKIYNGELVDSCEREYNCPDRYCGSYGRCYAHARSGRTYGCESKLVWKTDTVDFFNDLNLDTKEPRGYIALF
jgi:hypothetical protein